MFQRIGKMDTASQIKPQGQTTHSGELSYTRSEVGIPYHQPQYIGYAKSEIGHQSSCVDVPRASTVIGNSFVSSEVLLQRAVKNYIQSSVKMDKHYTLPVANQVMENMMQAVLSCQICKEISTRIKQLQCFHSICQRCLILLKTKHTESEMWVLKCSVCQTVTSWHQNTLQELPDVDTINKIIHRGNNSRSTNVKTPMKPGCITMYGDEDMTINIVSFTKEKVEIKRVLNTAQEKMKKCKLQTKQVQEYEKHINDSKTVLEKQIEHASDLFVSAIRSQQTHLMRELDMLFEKDFATVEKANTAIEMQMQSLQLVKQCCSVATRILENGGAPLDLNNFKKMVWDTMSKSENKKLPKKVQKRYRCFTHFRTEGYKYGELAEELGSLTSKTVAVQEEVHEKAKVHEEKLLNSEDEPIYDIPPDADNKYTTPRNAVNQEDCIYDEIPFYEASNLETADGLSCTSQQVMPCTPLQFSNIETQTMNRAMAMVVNRRKAINGNASDTDESHDSFSSDSFSSSSIERSTLPGSHNYDNLKNEVKNPEQLSNFFSETNRHVEMPLHRAESTSDQNDTQIAIMEKTPVKSVRHSLNLTTIQTNLQKTPAKLMYCIGKSKKTGSTCEEVQAFGSLPEFTIGNDDTIWICDMQNYRVQIHDGKTSKLMGTFKTCIQGVTLKPKCIAVSPTGKQVAVTCGKYATVWTSGGELIRQVGPHHDFGRLGGVTFDSNGNIIMADIENANIIVTNQSKKISNVSTGGDALGKSPWQGRFAVNQHDQVIVPDYGRHCVKIYDKMGKVCSKFGTFGVGRGQFRYPSCVAVDIFNRIYVVDECNNRISLFSPSGETFLGQILTKEDGLSFPHAINVFSDGNIAIADDSNTIKVYKMFLNI